MTKKKKTSRESRDRTFNTQICVSDKDRVSKLTNLFTFAKSCIAHCLKGFRLYSTRKKVINYESIGKIIRVNNDQERGTHVRVRIGYVSAT